MRVTIGGGWKPAGASSRSATVGDDLGPRPLDEIRRQRLRPRKLARHEAGKPRRHLRDMPPDLCRRPATALRHPPRRVVVGVAQPRDEPLVRLRKRLPQVADTGAMGG